MQKNSTNYIMGLWKFSDKVSIEQLEDVANKWATEDPNYLELYIRKTSKDQYGIGFTYKTSQDEPSERQNARYMEPVSDSLKKQFGNGLVGWDIASPVWIIK